MIYIGLDVHKKGSVYCCQDESGKVIRTGQLSHTRVAIEATGGWQHVAAMLQSQGAQVILSHPRRTRAIAAAKVKSDAIDARTLADLLRVGLLPEAYLPPPSIQALRRLVRTRASLVETRTRRDTRLLQEPGARSPDAGGVRTVCDGRVRPRRQGVDRSARLLRRRQDHRQDPAWGDRPCLADGAEPGQRAAQTTEVVSGVSGPEHSSRVRPRDQCGLPGRSRRCVALQTRSSSAVVPGYRAEGVLVCRQDSVWALDERRPSAGSERVGAGCISCDSKESAAAGGVRQDQRAPRLPGGPDSCGPQACYTGFSSAQIRVALARQRVAPDRLWPAPLRWLSRGPVLIERPLTRNSGPLPTCAANASANRCRTELFGAVCLGQGLDKPSSFIDESVGRPAPGVPHDRAPAATKLK